MNEELRRIDEAERAARIKEAAARDAAEQRLMALHDAENVKKRGEDEAKRAAREKEIRDAEETMRLHAVIQQYTIMEEETAELMALYADAEKRNTEAREGLKKAREALAEYEKENEKGKGEEK